MKKSAPEKGILLIRRRAHTQSTVYTLDGNSLVDFRPFVVLDEMDQIAEKTESDKGQDRQENQCLVILSPTPLTFSEKIFSHPASVSAASCMSRFWSLVETRAYPIFTVKLFQSSSRFSCFSTFFVYA